MPEHDIWCTSHLKASMDRLEECQNCEDPSLLVDLSTNCNKVLGTAWAARDTVTLFKSPVHPIINFIGGEAFYNLLSETERDTIYWQQVKDNKTTVNLVTSLIEACTYVEVFLTDLNTLDMSEMFSSREKIQSSFNGMRRIFETAIPTPKLPVPASSCVVVDAMENPHLFLKQQREARETKAVNPLEHLKDMFENMTKDLTGEDYDEFTDHVAEMNAGKGEMGNVFQGLKSLLVNGGSNKVENLTGIMSQLTGILSKAQTQKDEVVVENPFPVPDGPLPETCPENTFVTPETQGTLPPSLPPPDIQDMLKQLKGSKDLKNMSPLLDQLNGMMHGLSVGQLKKNKRK